MSLHLSRDQLRQLLPLTENRKADRTTLARAMHALCVAHGVPSEINYIEFKAQVLIRDTKGLEARVEFCGRKKRDQIDWYVIAWHMSADREVRGNRRISAYFAQERNPYHGLKATDVFNGVSDLFQIMDRRLEAIADGSAYEEQPT